MNRLTLNPDWAKLPIFDRSKWERVRFGDLVENLNETERDPAAAGLKRFIGLEHLEPGSLHIRSWGNVADGTTFTRRCRPGQVLFGKRRAYQRKVAVAEFDAVVSGDIYVFASKDGRLLPDLLPFICLSERFFQFAVETSAGSLSPRTNWNHLAQFEFAHPPLDQQRRIAEILWAVDEVQQAYDSQRSRLAAMRRSRVDYILRTSPVRELCIRDLGEIITGTTPRTDEPSYYEPPDYLFVSPADIGEARYVEETEKRVSMQGLESGRPIPPDSVMVVCIGSTIGKVAMAAKRCLTNQQINTVICSSEFSPLVIYHLLSSLREQFRKAAGCTAVPILNKSQFSSMRLTVPRAEIQTGMTRELYDFERSEHAFNLAASSAKYLKESIGNTWL